MGFPIPVRHLYIESGPRRYHSFVMSPLINNTMGSHKWGASPFWLNGWRLSNALILICKNAFKSILCKTSAILFMPQCVHPSILSFFATNIPSWVLPQSWHTDLGGRFNNAYELLHLRALKISMLYKTHIFQCMGKIFWVEFQRVPLKFHTKYHTHTLKDVDFIHKWKFKSP